MPVRGHGGTGGYAGSLVERLRLELEQTGDVKRRVSLLHAISRLRENLPPIPNEKVDVLSSAWRLDGTSESLAWDIWRRPKRRTIDELVQALSLIQNTGKVPGDQISSKLWLAHFTQDNFEAKGDAVHPRKSAELEAPNDIRVILAEAAEHAGKGRHEAFFGALERFADETGDSCVGASIFVDIARRERENFSDNSRVKILLEKALNKSELNDPILGHIVYLCEDIEAFDLQEMALLRWAETVANGNHSEIATEDREPGDGSDLSPAGNLTRSAVIWLEICRVREQKLGRPDDALLAIEKALDVLPGHPFLAHEKVRLLEKINHPIGALEAADSDVPGVVRAQMALAGGLPHSDVSKILKSDVTNRCPIEEAIREIIGETSDTAPDLYSEPEELIRWFYAHPRHPDAPGVARHLSSIGEDNPSFRLSVWENTNSIEDWSEVANKQTEESWPIALRAVATGQSESASRKSDAFAKWAEHTSDLSLSALLMSVAARLQSRTEGGDGEVALSHFRKAESLNPEVPEYRIETRRLLHVLKKWDELAELLADDAAIAADDQAFKTALFERAFIEEWALEQSFEAQQNLTEILQRDPADVHAALFDSQIALRLKDWHLFADCISKLAKHCSEDREMLVLTEAEVQLFQLGDFDKALQLLETVVSSGDEQAVSAAKIYLLLVYYELGDMGSALDFLKGEVESGAEIGTQRWMPDHQVATGFKGDLLSTGSNEMESKDPKEPASSVLGLKRLRNLISPRSSGNESNLADSLSEMATHAARPEAREDCRIASALLTGNFASLLRDEGEDSSIRSPRVIWHVAEDGRFDKSGGRYEVYLERAAMAKKNDDPEWVDWILEAARVLEEEGAGEKAFLLVNGALRDNPDEPGLLVAKLRLATIGNRFSEVVAVRKQLAHFYDSPEEEARELTEAARVLLNEIEDFEGARDLGLRAVSLVPEDGAANNTLMAAYKALGDDQAVSRLFEERIEVLDGTGELTTVYEEQANHKLAIGDETGALEALDNWLSVDRKMLGAHVLKIDTLMGMERYEEVINAMADYVDVAEDPVEMRTMVWRGADLIASELGDAPLAIAWLDSLVESGDRHPDSLKKILALARECEDWERSADALSRLSELESDAARRTEIWKEEARIRLEYLFDDVSTESIVEKILSSHPSDLETIELCLRFKSTEEMAPSVERAIQATRRELDENPVDVERVVKLKRFAEMANHKDLTSLCDDVLLLLTSGKKDPWPGDLVPGSSLDGEAKRRLFVHPEETRAPSRVASMASEAAAKALLGWRALPDISKKTLVDRRDDDSVRDWILAWANLLGVEKVDVHRVVGLSSPAEAVPKDVPALAIAGSLKSPLPSRHRFFLARNLWRATRGLGAFEEGDTAGPIRWIIACTVAILGERIELPVPTEVDLVSGAKKSLPRRLKRSLNEPCTQLLEESRESLRKWARATSFSADRFGLLAATQIAKVIPCIVEEAAGDVGTKSFEDDPKSTIMKIPRCKELLRFTLSEEYLTARKLVGLMVRNEGGTK